MDDPKTHRMIQTRNGVERVPRTQEGVAIRDYFQNTDLPKDLERAQVFISGTGPVLALPDPVAWSAEHDKVAQGYADKLKTQIDEKGYYKRSLETFAGRLADETGYPRDEMQAMIVSKFDGTYQQDPFDYLQGVRAAKGLPIRGNDPDLSAEQEPEL
ncbi:MAG: hypothetical protein ACSHXB_15035 [Sulfitobacter sp.]